MSLLPFLMMGVASFLPLAFHSWMSGVVTGLAYQLPYAGGPDCPALPCLPGFRSRHPVLWMPCFPLCLSHSHLPTITHHPSSITLTLAHHQSTTSTHQSVSPNLCFFRPAPPVPCRISPDAKSGCPEAHAPAAAFAPCSLHRVWTPGAHCRLPLLAACVRPAAHQLKKHMRDSSNPTPCQITHSGILAQPPSPPLPTLLYAVLQANAAIC